MTLVQPIMTSCGEAGRLCSWWRWRRAGLRRARRAAPVAGRKTRTAAARLRPGCRRIVAIAGRTRVPWHPQHGGIWLLRLGRRRGSRWRLWPLRAKAALRAWSSVHRDCTSLPSFFEPDSSYCTVTCAARDELRCMCACKFPGGWSASLDSSCLYRDFCACCAGTNEYGRGGCVSRRRHSAA